MKYCVPVFAITLLLSAALLFIIQPMYSKMILPFLGGSPQVWNTSMLFFQLCLLNGYAYAHITSKYFAIREQAILHCVLLVLCAAAMPAGIAGDLSPPDGTDPTFWQLTLMATTIGGPFFALSASAPMLQRWFSHTNHKDAGNPYFLYGASNLGSMGGLILYPVLIEPLFSLAQQSFYWWVGFVILILGVAFCALAAKATNINTQIKKAKPVLIKPMDRVEWTYLAFIPSALMLAVTTYITTDIASVPLLWVVPLALYLSTFILAFAKKQVFTNKTIAWYFGLSILVLLVAKAFSEQFTILPYFVILLHFATFFLAALLCHTTLYSKKPAAQDLTEFYFFMSLGGALGGFFSAIIVPNLFIIPFEYALIMVLALLVRYAEQQDLSGSIRNLSQARFKDIIYNDKALIFILSAVLGIGIIISGVPDKILGFFAIIFGISIFFLIRSRWLFAFAVLPVFLSQTTLIKHNALHYDRNFFGFMNVSENAEMRFFLHGSTVHGSQFLDPKLKTTLTAYYVEGSPVWEIFAILNRKGNDNVAILGLGAGGMSCFTAEGRHIDFYEIDKDVADVAQNTDLFTYLRDCGSDYSIILGDGRLKIAQQPDRVYDAIFLDAFSSDSVPVHLMTLEAAKIYREKLQLDGILIYHISNRYLDLEPVLSELSEALGVPARAKFGVLRKIKGTNTLGNESHYVVFTQNPEYLRILDQLGWDGLRKRRGVSLWTDQYSNILSVLTPQITNIRRLEETAKLKAAAGR